MKTLDCIVLAMAIVLAPVKRSMQVCPSEESLAAETFPQRLKNKPAAFSSVPIQIGKPISKSSLQPCQFYQQAQMFR
jgi:hypothetical protein